MQTNREIKKKKSPPIRKVRGIKNFVSLDSTEFRGGCIYVIRNLNNDKIYIGKTTDYKSRYKCHISDLSRGNHCNIYLLRAYRTGNKFEMFILETCEEDYLEEREMFWIKFFRSNKNSIGYNMTEGGEGRRGIEVTQETRDKLSKAHKGRKIISTAHHIPIVGYSSITGEFIGEFAAVKEAAVLLNLRRNAISGVLTGAHYHTNGYIFKYKEDDDYPKRITIDTAHDFNWTRFNKIDIGTGNVIEVVEGVKDLANELGVHRDTIRRRLKKHRCISADKYIYKLWSKEVENGN